MAEDSFTLDQEDLQNLLAALVEQTRALAARLSGDPDRESPCHFCGAPLPLWENLLVLQMTGVAAHVQCPDEALDTHLRLVGPDPAFATEQFAAALERRLQQPPLAACAGEIVVPRTS